MKSKNPLIILLCCAGLAVLYSLNMLYFSSKSDLFPVQEKEGTTGGIVFTETLTVLIDHELHGTGGWLPNDLPLSPGRLLDNKPNLQLGVLETVRYSSRVLRDNLSRQRTTDKIDPDCDRAFTCFSNDPFKWMMPSAEGKYKDGIDSLREYARRLTKAEASFYPRSDNLIQLLEQYASLLGGVNTRLLNASKTLIPNPDAYRTARPGTNKQTAKAAWHTIDDNFYYAQGIGYGLYHMFKAISIEFAGVLSDKNATVIVNDIISSLEESYFEPFIVTNGSKDGILANHSSNLRVFLDDARQKTNSLISILDQG